MRTAPPAEAGGVRFIQRSRLGFKIAVAILPQLQHC
jgi:hypothetical protein